MCVPKTQCSYSAGRKSLFGRKISLFFKFSSLLICTGNCSRSRWGTGGSCLDVSAWSANFAVFPVKFPVSREYSWRSVRIPLPRQPGSLALCVSPPAIAEKPATGGLLKSGGGLWTPNLPTYGAKSPKVSGSSLKYSHFRETTTGDWVRSPLQPKGAIAERVPTWHRCKRSEVLQGQAKVRANPFTRPTHYFEGFQTLRLWLGHYESRSKPHTGNYTPFINRC